MHSMHRAPRCIGVPRALTLHLGFEISECGSLLPLFLPLTRQRRLYRRLELRRWKAATSRRTPKPEPAVCGFSTVAEYKKAFSLRLGGKDRISSLLLTPWGAIFRCCPGYSSGQVGTKKCLTSDYCFANIDVSLGILPALGASRILPPREGKIPRGRKGNRRRAVVSALLKS